MEFLCLISGFISVMFILAIIWLMLRPFFHWWHNRFYQAYCVLFLALILLGCGTRFAGNHPWWYLLLFLPLFFCLLLGVGSEPRIVPKESMKRPRRCLSRPASNPRFVRKWQKSRG